tara:strand:+ start:4068 stop:4982 length:915 start_codon:yes stop_codon:yes gene_type:complete
MKIYLNRSPKTGPWGGGNKTVTKLSEKLVEQGHEVVYELCKGIDIIFCFDPRPNERGEQYANFLDYRNKTDCKIIQRVGDLGTHGKPQLTSFVKETIELSDFLIFPSEWAKEKIEYKKNNYKIVHNAPLEMFYNYRNENSNIVGQKIKVITHHWSTNPKKGFDYYNTVDRACRDSKFLSFTYIGRLPEDMEMSNHIEATGDNNFIAKKLSESHIYLTASEEEAGANHVLEAMAAGIPVVYHENGGSIPNYCNGYGLSFEDEMSMFVKIRDVAYNYADYKAATMKYQRNMSNVIEEYIEVICNIG